jgi:hypothetical protein
MELPGWMRGAVRREYANPHAIGWAAWWERLGDVVAFERLDGTMVYEWGDDEADTEASSATR